ncbi:hypothetical protein TELCIR_22453, partial [Teladorsagia circumcincta]
GLVPLALNYALANLDHVMVPTQQRLLSSFFAMMNYSVRCVINHDASQGDFPLTAPLIDFEVQMSGEWQPWLSRVPVMEIE